MKPYYFTPRERKGYFLLFTLFILGHSLYFLHDYFNGIDPTQETIIIEEIIKENKQKEPTSESKTESTNEKVEHLNTFDPNIISTDSLSKYGFSTYAINNLEKYRTAGGSFKNEGDLLKIYGIDSADVNNIKHLLKFPKTKSSTRKTPPATHVIKPKKPRSNSSMTLKTADNIETIKQSFDPNEADYQTLRSHGFSKYAANNLIKYRSKGGQILKKSDLEKIYGVDDSLMITIEPYITFNNEQKKNKNTKEWDDTNSFEIDSIQFKEIKEEENIVFDINKATQQELMSLRGIGPVISKNIIEYRSKLGGYNKIEQLNEVYGVTPELMLSIKDKLFLEESFSKFYVPSLTFKEVLRHPYTDYETTKLLKNISILEYEKEILILIENKSFDQRLVPYLELEDPLSKQ